MAHRTTDIDDIIRDHKGQYVICNDMGYRAFWDANVYDVIVWDCKKDSINDHGLHAVARYTTTEPIDDGYID